MKHPSSLRSLSALFILSAVAMSLGTSGCASHSSYVHSDAALGRVVIYRNGVAYFEREAHVSGPALKLAVPADKVDDFLKSLTVTDLKSGKPAPVSYPTNPGQKANNDGLIDMSIGLGAGSHDLRLSYVTESPAWKPTYRLILGEKGKVRIEGWAIVDNISGEDWLGVKLGVGASSALAFRFNLHDVRMVGRETLQEHSLLALAPPTGGSTFSGPPGGGGGTGEYEFSDDLLQSGLLGDSRSKRIQDESERVATLSPQSISRNDKGGNLAGKKSKPASESNRGGWGTGSASGAYAPAPALAPPPPPKYAGDSSKSAGQPSNQGQTAQQQSNLVTLAQNIRTQNKPFVVEGYANSWEADPQRSSLERANKLKDQLIAQGVPSNLLQIDAKGAQAGKNAGAKAVPVSMEKVNAALANADLQPIGTSHFESSTPMNVKRGESAMVSVLHHDTIGESVYFYDPESTRGNKTFPFRAVRFKNPTKSALETGPVSVFGEGRFIGEGLTDSVPPENYAFVPFALDRQIVVDMKEDEKDHIKSVVTAQRGIFTTEVSHTRRSAYTLTSRLHEKTSVYLKHTVAHGYKLSKGPDKRERIGQSDLFRVEIAPGEKIEVLIEEETPLTRTIDIRTNEGMGLIQAYVSKDAAEGPLRDKLKKVVETQKEMANIEQQILTTREQMNEYRTRVDELHNQIFSLKAVKSAGPLMQNLEKKMSEMSDKVSKATIDVVNQEEKLMVARIKLQDTISELTLEKPVVDAPKVVIK